MQKKNADTKNYGKQFFSGIAVLAISTFIVKVIGLFYKIPMIAYLGAEGMGYFNSAYDIYSLFFVISTTGIPVAISILVAENKVQGRLKNIKRIFRVSLIALGSLGLLGTLAMGVFHDEFAQIINNDRAAFCILAISPTLLMICLSSAIRGYFQGNQSMIPTAVSQVIEALGKLFLGLGFAIIAINKGYDIPRVAAFAVLGLTLGVAISLLFLVLYKILYRLKSDNYELSNSEDSNGTILKKLLNIAIPITLSSTILSLTKIIDMTMILGRLGDIGYTQGQSNAIYGSYSTMAVSIYNLPATLISAIALPLVPLLVSAIESGDLRKEMSVLSSSLKMASLIAFPTGLGIAVFSEPILKLLFASQEKEIEYTAPLLSLLGLSVFLSAMITITNAILQAYKQVKKPIISMAIGIVVKLIFAFLLIGIPQINIYGAPISTFVSSVVIVAFNLYFIVKRSGKIDKVYNLFGKPFLATFLAVGIGMVLYLFLQERINSRLLILPIIVVIAMLYGILILKLGAINEDEILMLPKGEKILKILNKIHLV
ncbi:MAG: polysaccharide biosynthesis protein [Clostridia bacterium]|nr:polysaccharide biosynthesis protein [Clostridia bacterium]